MIDTHCHLEDKAFDKDLDSVVGRAREAGVEAIIVSALGADIAKGLAIAKRFPNYLFLSAGLAPQEVAEDYLAYIEAIEAAMPHLVAVGEVGLDYYWVRDAETRALQKEAFRAAIGIAKRHGKPVVVHSHSAGKYALEILGEEGAEKVQMHAFDGAVKYALDAVSNGWFFSIPTSVLFVSQKQDLAREVPLENLLMETDSPAMPPVRGERNEPANLKLVAAKIAELKEVPVETVIEVTTANAKKLFRLP